MAEFDVVVVGAGIFGSCTAYHCQKLGLRTLLLEQFQLGHTNGSSHGKTRIIRYAHTESHYVPLVHDAYGQIDELAKKRNEKLWKKTGLLWVAVPSEIESMATILKKHGAVHSVIKGTEINKKYRQFKFQDDVSGLLDPMGGVIFADKWLDAFRSEFRKLGGTLRDNEEMISFSERSTVSVTTSKATYSTKKLIFTVGSWIGKLLPQLPLCIQPQSVHVCYWKVKDQKDENITEIGNFPVFIGSEFKEHPETFAMGALDYPNAIKFCAHHGHPMVPGEKHSEKPVQKFVDAPSNFIQQHLPLFDHKKPFLVDRCKYTVAEDNHYIIDHIPNSHNVLVGGCGSGSGFKVAPAIGRALAEMAAERQTSVDVSFFSLQRFKSKL